MRTLLNQLLPRLGLWLGLSVFLLILFLPTPDGLTPQGKRMIAVTLLMAILWVTEAVPIAVTALLPIPLFPLLGIMASKQATLSYANHLVFLFLGGFMIAIAIERWNLHQRIALSTLLILGPKPKRIILGFMLITAFLSLWISNTSTVMMIYPIAMAVVMQVYKDSDKERDKAKFGLILMLSIAYAASVGGIGTLIGTPPNILMAGVMGDLFSEAPDISFVSWMIFALPFALLFLFIIWSFLCHILFPKTLAKVPLTNKTTSMLKDDLKELGPMSVEEKRVLAVFLCAALLWLFRAPLTLGSLTIPGWSSLFSYATYLHDSTVAMTMGLLLFFIPKGGNTIQPDDSLSHHDTNLLSWHVFEEKTPWGVLLLFGGGFALAAGMKESGVSTWIGSKLAASIETPGWVIVLLICLLITFLTEITSNTATASLVLPILAALAITKGLHPYLLVIPATLSASCAFMLPVATPPNAIVFGSGWVSIKQMARVGFLINLIGAILISAYVYLLGGSILNFDPCKAPDWGKNQEESLELK
jgi:sodium-dependent dicarboxylate transporter 2/3/5